MGTQPFTTTEERQHSRSSGQTGLLGLSNERYRMVSDLLNTLQDDVGARCILLTDAHGRFIARTGDVEQLDMEELASLLGGSIAAMLEVGHTLDNDQDAINLVYREGKSEYLYAINIGQQLMLILIIDRQPYSSRLGSVWYYARQTAVTLYDELAKNDPAEAPKFLKDEALDQAFSDELDRLWQGDDETDLFGSSHDSFDLTFAEADTHEEYAYQDEGVDGADDPLSDFEYDNALLDDDSDLLETADSTLLSYEEAMANQLIPENFGSR